MGYPAACRRPHPFAEIFMTATHAAFHTIALVVRQNTDGIAESVGSVVDFLQQGGYTVVFEEQTAAHLELKPADVQVMNADGIGANCDAAIVMGGDGTMLGIARQL